MLNGFPYQLVLNEPEWLQSNNNASLSVLERYRAQGLLSGALPGTSEEQTVNPVLAAPLTDAAGGVIYFNARPRQVLATVFQVLIGETSFVQIFDVLQVTHGSIGSFIASKKSAINFKHGNLAFNSPNDVDILVVRLEHNEGRQSHDPQRFFQLPSTLVGLTIRD